MNNISYKIVALLMAVLLSTAFVGCSDDNDPTEKENNELPAFNLDQESVMVKIGTEHRTTVTVKEGGGEYDAFILNDQIAKAEIKDGIIQIEGLMNGKTSLVVSDKHSRYRRMPVISYTTDELQLSHTTFDMLILPERSSSQMLGVKVGNGEYKAVSDNPDLVVKVNEAGDIILTATVKNEPFMGNITVTDCIGLTATIAVTVKEGTEPFVPEELKALATDAEAKFFWDERNIYESYLDLVNETTPEGKQRYGWNYYGYQYFYLEFAGGKEVGKKTDACCTYITYYADPMENQPIALEIIKNDGTNIWGIYSYTNPADGTLIRGHFCTPL